MFPGFLRRPALRGPRGLPGSPSSSSIKASNPQGRPVLQSSLSINWRRAKTACFGSSAAAIGPGSSRRSSKWIRSSVQSVTAGRPSVVLLKVLEELVEENPHARKRLTDFVEKSAGSGQVSAMAEQFQFSRWLSECLDARPAEREEIICSSSLRRFCD